MAILRLDELSVHLGEPPRPVLDRISLAFGSGTLTLVLGANGSGKSVLLRTILGLVPSSAGTVFLDDKALNRHREHLHRISGVCFQNPDLQLFGETVAEDLALAVDPTGAQPDHNLIAQALNRFALTGKEDVPPWELSGGQRRRLALAGACVGDPPLLFLDEPFLELDYPSVTDLRDVVVDLTSRGTTVVLASHESRDVWDYADQVVILHEGRVVYAGAPEGAHAYVSPAYGLRPWTEHTPQSASPGRRQR